MVSRKVWQNPGRGGMCMNRLVKHAICSFTTGAVICAIAIGGIWKASADSTEFIAISPDQRLEPINIAPIQTPEPIIVPIVVPTLAPTPVPEFQTIRCKLTAYCIEDYPHICNNGNASSTATGTKPTPGRTVAVDPKIIPYFSNVIINGNTYIAEDTGGHIKGNRVDIVFSTHQEALEFGVQYADVHWVK